MLVEDHRVLHCDISWGNILINATHVDKDQQDDFCDRPFIDIIHDVKYVSQCLYGHTCLGIVFDTGQKQERSMLCYLILIVHVSLEIIIYVGQLLEVKSL